MNLDVRKLFPDVFEPVGVGWTNFLNKVQELVDYYQVKIDGIRYFLVPERTQTPLESAELVGAYIGQSDSIRTVKDKIGKAFYTHKNLSIFNRTIKPVLDEIMNEDTRIINTDIFYDLFRIDESLIDSPALIEQINFTPQPKPKGIVYIDLRSIPDSTQIGLIREQVFPMLPAYFNVLFGVAFISNGDPFTIGLSLIDFPDLIDTPTPPWTFMNTYLQY